MVDRIASSTDIWKIHDFLTKYSVNEVFQRFHMVFEK
jgi:hypothetical protein